MGSFTISTLYPHRGSLEKVPQLPGPDHPYYVRTKKSPAILKTLICSTVAYLSVIFIKEQLLQIVLRATKILDVLFFFKIMLPLYRLAFHNVVKTNWYNGNRMRFTTLYSGRCFQYNGYSWVWLAALRNLPSCAK